MKGCTDFGRRHDDRHPAEGFDNVGRGLVPCTHREVFHVGQVLDFNAAPQSHGCHHEKRHGGHAHFLEFSFDNRLHRLAGLYPLVQGADHKRQTINIQKRKGSGDMPRRQGSGLNAPGSQGFRQLFPVDAQLSAQRHDDLEIPPGALAHRLRKGIDGLHRPILMAGFGGGKLPGDLGSRKCIPGIKAQMEENRKR